MRDRLHLRMCCGLRPAPLVSPSHAARPVETRSGPSSAPMSRAMPSEALVVDLGGIEPPSETHPARWDYDNAFILPVLARLKLAGNVTQHGVVRPVHPG